MEQLYFQVKSRHAWACINTTLGVCLLPFSALCWQVSDAGTTQSVPGPSFLSLSSPPQKEQGSRFTYLVQDGPVNSPASASELNVYPSSPRRFEGFLWSPAGSSPIHVVKRESREKKSKARSRDWFVGNFPFVSPKQTTIVFIQVQMIFFPPMQS